MNDTYQTRDEILIDLALTFAFLKVQDPDALTDVQALLDCARHKRSLVLLESPTQEP
jgi:hypothetical protein